LLISGGPSDWSGLISLDGADPYVGLQSLPPLLAQSVSSRLEICPAWQRCLRKPLPLRVRPPLNPSPQHQLRQSPDDPTTPLLTFKESVSGMSHLGASQPVP